MSASLRTKWLWVRIPLLSLGLYLYPECFLNFLWNLYISPWLGKIFKFMCAHSKKMHWILTFFLIPSHSTPYSKLFPKSLLSPRQAEKLLISPDSIFHKICFPQQQKREEETMIGLTKIKSGNMKMTWNIRLFTFCMICNFIKCMTLKFWK